jgi:hypothetical protein
MLKQTMQALGNIVGEMADKATDTVLNPIGQAFGVPPTECKLFRDALSVPEKGKGAETPAEIDYAPVKKAAVEKNQTTVDLIDRATAEPAEAEDKEKGLGKEEDMSLTA